MEGIGIQADGGLGEDAQAWSQAESESESPEASKKEATKPASKGSAKAKAKGKAKGKAKDSGKGTGKRHMTKAEKAKAVGVQKENDEDDDTDVTKWKKCMDCNLWLQKETDFYQDQGSCKCCSNHRKAFTRAATTQGCDDLLAKMAKDALATPAHHTNRPFVSHAHTHMCGLPTPASTGTYGAHIGHGGVVGEDYRPESSPERPSGVGA